VCWRSVCKQQCVGRLFASAAVGQAMLHHILHTDTCVCDSTGISPLLRILCCALGRMDCNEGISVLHIKGRWSKAHLIDVARSAFGLEDVMPQPMPCFFGCFVLRDVDHTRLNIEA
jgi:hypothetical protein